MVEPILRVAEVNMATGNIHYDGTVQVDGEVQHGMLVQASGDIIVSGTVDGGVLEAGAMCTWPAASLPRPRAGKGRHFGPLCRKLHLARRYRHCAGRHGTGV